MYNFAAKERTEKDKRSEETKLSQLELEWFSAAYLLTEFSQLVFGIDRPYSNDNCSWIAAVLD
jgi:hypothetical protein